MRCFSLEYINDNRTPSDIQQPQSSFSLPLPFFSMQHGWERPYFSTIYTAFAQPEEKGEQLRPIAIEALPKQRPKADGQHR
nr:hypothetical protein CFP56_14393 [Quercus suber]